MNHPGDLERLEKVRLMLVDDEERFRTTLAKRLGEKGVKPRTASGGVEALQSMKDGPVDVVVLDIKMPGMDGIETLGQIKKIDPDTEVILLTGHANVESAVEGMRLGAYDYLMKPCDLEQLLEKILQAYDHKVSREESRVKDKMKEQVEHWQKHWSRS
ncbi:sigma-54-dependent transcriptional regulator [Desulfonatronovibrio hydrogenovorans]|uniref:sigma-54-dependent transcriptional regulator n=1 Tax=Desulfonatronovibrio hydrogenovorans TaxID=53245 RepID=UPI0006896600|nr:response regulator [Desulfonatronovibrio hydrogenovorans]